MRYLLMFVAGVMLLAGGVVSAQSTDMFVIMGNTDGEQDTTTLNPLFCSDRQCTRIVDELFPYLLNIDPETKWLIPADDEAGLVESWEIEDNIVTYTLRDNLTWSDGTPITAYDVFFSYQVAYRVDPFDFRLNAHIEGAVPLDDRTIQFVFIEATCNALVQTNFQIAPAHVYDAEFADSIDYNGGDIVAWFEGFPKTQLSSLSNNPEFSNPTVTYGAYQLVERRFEESIHMLSTDGEVAFRYDNVPGTSTAVERFLRGEINLLVNPPYDRLRDLQADPATTLYRYDGDATYLIALNQADPDNPQPAFDEDGNAIEQDSHPLFVDPVIREAMQMALDVPAIIDATVEGHGQQLAGLLPPSYFAYDAEQAPVSRDVMGARQLLFDAGWRDIDDDGVRECLDCAFAEFGTSLTFSLGYLESSSTVPPVDLFALTQLVSKQMDDIGIEVLPFSESSFGPLFDQEYDMYLIHDVPVDLQAVTLWDFFSVDEDVPEVGYNFTSYNNPEVERLLDEAERVPDCDADVRRDLYQQVEDILIEDAHYLWLFSPDVIVATRQSADLPLIDWEEILP